MSINDNEFELKDPLIEDECEEDDNIDNVVVVKVKRENKPKLSAKYENYMAFGYWFITKHIQHDNIQPFIDALRHKSDLTTQNEFYSQFVDNIKNHKKELKLSMKPKKITKKVTKVDEVPKVEPTVVSTDEPIVQLHVQLALQTDTKPTKTKPTKTKSTKTKSTNTKSTINKPPIIETAVVPTTVVPTIESDNKPIETDNKPIETDNKPIETDNKPIETDNKPKKIKKVKKDIQT
jgi:hypothetical protein